MSRIRVALALVWLVAAATAQAARPAAALGERLGEPSSQEELSVASAGGVAIAARTAPSPSPAREAQGLAYLALPTPPAPSASAVTVEARIDIAPQLAALPHRQRGPPLPARVPTLQS